MKDTMAFLMVLRRSITMNIPMMKFLVAAAAVVEKPPLSIPGIRKIYTKR